MTEKKITINNAKLTKLIKEKGKFVTEGRGLTKEIERLTKEREELGKKLQKIKNKLVPILQKEVTLGEFDELGTVDINKKTGEVEVSIFDMIESFKGQIREHRSQNGAGKNG